MNMNEPKLRFKADDGSQFPDWEEKKLGDDVQFLNGRAYKQDELLKSGKYLVLRVGNLFTNDSYYYSDLELDDDKYIENGNLIYAWSATFGPRIYHGKKCIYHYHIWKLKFDENAISKMFLNYCLLHDVENVKSQRTGGTMVHITKNAMENRKLYFPCFAEQQKIAEFLSTIDTVIEKQKETVSAWEERKKGVMQKLFSQEVRFKADDGSEFPEWEEKKLGDVADFFNGDRSARYPKETDFVKYGVAFLNTENLHNTIVDISEKCKYITYEKYCELSGAKIQLLDIIYCLRGSVGLCSLNTILEEGTVASSLMVIRAVDGIIDPIYLYNSLNSDFVLGQLYQCLNGSCAGNLSAKDMAMFKIKCPCLAEQQKIADCLSSLDDVIAKQKATLAAWEELKKGLLQQMFV